MSDEILTTDENTTNLTDIVDKDIQQIASTVDDAENSLNKINSILQQMKGIAEKAANDTEQKSDRLQLQRELNQLSSELNQIGDTPEFETASLSASAYDYNDYNQRTACLCYVAPGVDMSYVTLNEKDSRLSGDLTELIDNYIYVKNGLDTGTNVTIILNTDGRVTITGYINEYSTDNHINPNAYEMTSTVDEQNGNVMFSGYGLSFTIPYQDYIEFLGSGIAERTKEVTIHIDNYYDRVYPNNTIPTKGYVNYYGSGTKLRDFNIYNADNLTSFYMSGTTGSYTNGAISLHVMYTLADGTRVDDIITNYNGNIRGYSGAGGLKITFNYDSRYNPYWQSPYCIIDLPSVYKLVKAGGIQTYKKTSRIVNVPYQYNPYAYSAPSVYTLKQNQVPIDISTPDKASKAVETIDKSIQSVSKQLETVSELKAKLA